MKKVCENCSKPFTTKDTRQRSCGKKCADILRSVNAWKPSVSVTTNTSTGRFRTDVPNVANYPKMDLPLPEDLPAPYAKRVHDMWELLVGDGDAPTRIA